MSSRDFDPRMQPRRQRPELEPVGGGAMRTVMWAAIVALVLVSAFAVAVFAGVIRVGPGSNFAANTQPPVQNQAVARGAAPGQPAAATPPPQPTVTRKETYGDWVFLCEQSPRSGNNVCGLMQTIADSKTKAVVFLWTIRQNRDGGLTAVWQTPNSVMLPAGISLDLGAAKPLAIPFESCARGACRAVVKLNDDFVNLLASADKAVATVVAPNNQKVDLKLSVKGLADGLAALQKVPPLTPTANAAPTPAPSPSPPPAN